MLDVAARLPRLAVAIAVGLFAATALAQEPQGDDGKALGAGPPWRGPVRPAAANEVFATGDGCSMCHSAAKTATAMRSATGDDVSPHGLWRGTVMANAFLDPYWRAAVEKESAAHPERAAAIESTCMRCHAPMAHQTATLGGQPVPRLADAAHDPLARDGVSCTVCHKIEAQNLGTPASFGGGWQIAKSRAIYGPFADPAAGPMQMHSGYVPQLGAHIQSSAHCATCHTLTTHHAPGAPGFPEQTPYLEWRNSEFTDEKGSTPTSRSCQQCHMPDLGTVRIARNPGGRDFLIEPRPFRGHAFVGGNAFLLELLAANREALGVDAPAAALERMAQATKAQLHERTASVAVSALRRDGDALAFEVTVANRCGHKFPAGYPARRAWLHVQVRDGNKLVFESGAPGKDGRIQGLGDELAQPHRATVRKPDEVPIYELVGADTAGHPTTTLTDMATRQKDTRLLPRGWRADGPHAGDTAPVGTDGDADFAAGGDTVAYRIALPAGTSGTLRVLAFLYYQTIPPAWVESLRGLDTPAAKQFVGLYDGADKTPETIAVGQAFAR